MTKTHLLLCAATALAATFKPVHADPFEMGCFEAHIRESIGINKKNIGPYTKLAGSNAKSVLTTLIASEYLTTIPAALFDNQAKFFHRKGMDLLCQEFVSMEPKEIARNRAPREAFQKFNWQSYSVKIQKAISQNDVSLIRNLSLNSLKTLNKGPYFNCFTRHMVESIYRIAYFVNIREAEAKSLKVRSPKRLMMNLIGSHLLSLPFAEYIDQLAKPIQESGVGILCNELPDLLRDLPLTEEQV